MIRISIDKKELAKLKKLKVKLSRATQDRGFLKSTGQLLVSRGKQNLEDGGSASVSWPLLAESTRKQKLRQGYSLKPLQREGLLKRSLNWQVTGGLYVSGVNYIKYHQSDEPRTVLPERKVYTVEQEDIFDIRDFLIRRFEKTSL